MFIGYIQHNKRQKPQFFVFKIWHDSFEILVKKLGSAFDLQKELLKTQSNHDEIYEDTWNDKIDEWLDYVKNNVPCTASSYARCSKAMQEITGFGMKDDLSSPGLG